MEVIKACSTTQEVRTPAGVQSSHQEVLGQVLTYALRRYDPWDAGEEEPRFHHSPVLRGAEQMVPDLTGDPELAHEFLSGAQGEGHQLQQHQLQTSAVLETVVIQVPQEDSAASSVCGSPVQIGAWGQGRGSRFDQCFRNDLSATSQNDGVDNTGRDMDQSLQHPNELAVVVSKKSDSAYQLHVSAQSNQLLNSRQLDLVEQNEPVSLQLLPLIEFPGEVSTLQKVNAACFIEDAKLRDPRPYSAFFLAKPARVWELVRAWGPLPSVDDNLGFNHIEIHTDGSAVMGDQWPSSPIMAGWGVIFLPSHLPKGGFLVPHGVLLKLTWTLRISYTPTGQHLQ